jgi:hypothetical protein
LTESKRRQAGPAEKLLLELAGGLVCYYALFVIGPALSDSTSELRLKLAELHDSLGRVRDRCREIRKFRSEIDQWGKDRDNA